jgi:transcriptional regulator with XRE-family HTH domain
MSEHRDETLGHRLRQLRQARGESLSQAATGIGCTKPHLHDLERGVSANPSLALLRGLARHYGCSVAQIIGDDT